jgi:serine protease AprX
VGEKNSVRIRHLGLALGAGLVALQVALGLSAGTLARPASGPARDFVIAGRPGQAAAIADLVRTAGGRVEEQLTLVNGVRASLTRGALSAVEASPAIAGITPDSTLKPQATSYDQTTDPNSLYSLSGALGVRKLWQQGFTGAGVDVALVDTGVTPVQGLSAAGKVVYGPDLSFDSQAPNLRNLDGYGHGTHLASIIAGRDEAATQPYASDTTDFLGLAPDARIVSVKVGDSRGVSDVSQVIAGLDWVGQHAHTNGLNIKVVNLAYGTDSTQSYLVDPLAFAVEALWRQGIAVVVSAGNRGPNSGGMNDPATDPYVMAISAIDTNYTATYSDDSVASFSSYGNAQRKPDFGAPGVHVAGLRVPGSWIDQQYGSTATVGTRFFRGSGTSQAAAVTSGVVALLQQAHPGWSDDQVKAALGGTAQNVSASGSVSQAGAHEIQPYNAVSFVPGNNVAQTAQVSTGSGSLELARGSFHVVDSNGNALTGEQDIFGHAFNSSAMATATLNGGTWSGGTWNGGTWSGSGWDGGTWSCTLWNGGTWSGSSWSGGTWSGGTWSGGTWSASSYSSMGWNGGTWSGGTWSGSTWDGGTWSGGTWSAVNGLTGGTWSTAGFADSSWA